MKNKKASVLLFWKWSFCLLCLTVLVGCVTSEGGSSRPLQPSLATIELFRAGVVLPDHTYYMQGNHPDPDAVIAVSNAFQLKSRLWEKVDWTQKELADVVFWMENSEVGLCSTGGGDIVAPDGEKIGVWYSPRDISVVKKLAAGVVEIYSFQFRVGSPCRREYLRDQL